MLFKQNKNNKKSKSGVVVASKGTAWGEEFMLETNKAKTYIFLN